MKSKLLFLGILVVLLASCNKYKENEIEQLAEKYNIDINKEKLILHIIPVEGCSDCLELSQQFVAENINNAKIIYIISSIEPKTIKIKYPQEILNSHNVIQDIGAYAMKLNLLQRSPAAFFIENGNVVDYKTLNTNTSKETFKLMLEFVM